MNISTFEAKAQKIWFDKDNLWIMLQDGRQLSVPLSYFPRLKNASEDDLNDYIISGSGTGLHWEKLDEDISVPNLLIGQFDNTRNTG